MFRAAVLLGLTVLLILPACAMREPEVARQDVEQRPVALEQELPAADPGARRAEERQAQEFIGQAPKIEDVKETIVLEAKNGNVTFSHQQHAKMNDCATCHQGTPGAIPDFGKDKAHALCIGCHKEQNAGPTKCGECHKKS